MRMRASRLSSRNPLMRACSATRTSSSPAPSGRRGGAGPDDLDLVAVDPDGGAALEPGVGHPPGEPGPDEPLLLGPRGRWAGGTPPPPLGTPSRSRCLASYYEITRLHREGQDGRARSLEEHLEAHVGGREPEPLVEAMGVGARRVGGQLDAVAARGAGPGDGLAQERGAHSPAHGGRGARAPTRSRRTARRGPGGDGRR